MTKIELRDFLIENFVDENGNLDLKGLDFSEFNGNVYIGNMKVKKNLHQSEQKVGGMLWQQCQKVKDNLLQGYQKVGKDLYQDHQEVEGEIEND